MSISVAGRPIPQPSSLSDLCRLVLAFVDGGQEWLAWALASPSARYDFDDETMLVSQVQQGLHASAWTLLPTLSLMVSPVKLMTLGLADLRVLARAEGGDASTVTASQKQRVLADHGLLVQSDLAAVDTWLAGLGVGGAAVCQAMSLNDRVAVGELMRGSLPDSTVSGDAATEAEAAAFAVQQARTPSEFVDYMRFYQALAAQPDATSLGAQGRHDRAVQRMQALLPCFFGALDCPQVTGLPSPGAVAQAVSAWLTTGRRIGFARLSEGLQQLVMHTAYRDEAGAAAQRIVDLYLASAQSFLASARVRHGRMGQDGATCLYPLEVGQQQAQLQLGANGVISLRSYGLVPARPATPPPPSAAATDVLQMETQS
ncbi:hypothetical protein AACH06_07090 [Ideonella sp. DXS29W]|uniref:Uncharacterized protein n=1 Tax=Ideonella lacteola TaxID=2984193 RepID=A0ABU9BM66_9BURK